jgi:predicted GIY-YIG superfamily endonuclease
VPYYVYILASRRYGTLYIGITNNMSRRLEEHRLGKGSQFVRDYKVHRLVHVETFDDPESAIQREAPEEMESRLENPPDRGAQSGLGGSNRFAHLINGRPPTDGRPRESGCRPRAGGDPYAAISRFHRDLALRSDLVALTVRSVAMGPPPARGRPGCKLATKRQ